MEQADDCETVSSVFGMRRPLEPYRFQPTFSEYQKRHRGSQKEEHQNTSGHSSQRLPRLVGSRRHRRLKQQSQSMPVVANWKLVVRLSGIVLVIA